jgi:hypothetical protein
VQKSASGDVSIGVLNQARLRPLFHGFCWFKTLCRYLFNFSEKAYALLVHYVFKSFFYELLCFLAGAGFFANMPKAGGSATDP